MHFNVHHNVWENSAASCAKAADPVEMQFGMLSRVDLENVLHENVDASVGRSTFGVSDQLKSAVKNRILGLCKRVSCAKKRVDRS